MMYREDDTQLAAPAATPTIQIEAGRLHELATEAEAALLRFGAPFYARAGEIVRPIIEEVPALKGRKTKVARLKTVTADALRDYLSQAARWERYNIRLKKCVPSDPPPEVARTILARDGSWSFPPLAGVITTPTLRPDGTILAEPGYDPATRLLLMEPPRLPLIPDRPTREDALAALALLEGLLGDFPFVSAADRSVALSAIMTTVARGALQVVPMHGITAPTAGTGKTYVIDLASALASGEIAPAMCAGRTEEETEKRLAAAMMEGQAIISIDNLNGDLGGDFICQAVERPIVKPRILGKSENRRIENTATIFGNGNNMRLVGDMTRRVILCRLDANLERPELRRFNGNPLATVLADRGRYIAAVLTIVRAYLVAGCPNPCPPLASFEEWSRIVRSPLVWLGRADPVDTMENARADDPDLASLRAVVAAWKQAIGEHNPRTTGELRAEACSTLGGGASTALYKALVAIASPPARSEVDAMKLGKWLGRNRGKVIEGLKIVGAEDRKAKQQKWWLTQPGKEQQ